MSGYLQGKDMAAPGVGKDAQAAVGAPAKPVSMAVTIPSLRSMRAAGQKISMLTCYDASFASLMDRCGVEVLLIGDSLGMSASTSAFLLPRATDAVW